MNPQDLASHAQSTPTLHQHELCSKDSTSHGFPVCSLSCCSEASLLSIASLACSVKGKTNEFGTDVQHSSTHPWTSSVFLGASALPCWTVVRHGALGRWWGQRCSAHCVCQYSSTAPLQMSRLQQGNHKQAGQHPPLLLGACESKPC